MPQEAEGEDDNENKPDEDTHDEELAGIFEEVLGVAESAR